MNDLAKSLEKLIKMIGEKTWVDGYELRSGIHGDEVWANKQEASDFFEAEKNLKDYLDNQ